MGYSWDVWEIYIAYIASWIFVLEIYLGKFDHDRSLFSRALEIIVSKGNHPRMAARFRLVKYYNLPRYMIYVLVMAIQLSQTRK
jgi:hypothetical protein